MTKEQHLLICLSEECAEVTQAISKALRFGLDNKNPKTGIVNRDHIITELTDVIALVGVLVERGTLNEDSIMDEKALEAKVKKVHDYMIYSKDVGILDD